MTKLNLSASINVSRLLYNPALCLPNLIIPTFETLPIPLQFPHQPANVTIKAVVLDKDNCFAKDHDDKVWPAYSAVWERLRNEYPKESLLIVSNSAGTDDDINHVQAEKLERDTGVTVLRHSTKKPGCHAEIMEYFQSQGLVEGPHEVAVVGDRLFTDMLMSNMMGSWGVWGINIHHLHTVARARGWFLHEKKIDGQPFNRLLSFFPIHTPAIMSSRGMRRLEKQRLKSLAPVSSESEPEEEYTPKTNAFAFLGGETSEEETSTDYEDCLQGDSNEPLPQPVKISAPKKARKIKQTRKSKQPVVDSDEELDRILQEYAVKEEKKEVQEADSEDEETLPVSEDVIDPCFKVFTPARFARCVALLALDPRDLDPDREFRNLFGNLLIEAIEDADSTSSSFISPEQMKQIQKMKKLVRGWGGSDRRSIPGTTRKLVLTKIRDDWLPSPRKEVGMEEISAQALVELKMSQSEDWMDVIRDEVAEEARRGIKYYKFTRNVDDRLTNAKFYVATAVTPDHEALIGLMHLAPYHVETLIQVATILVRQGDKSNSSGLTERALFVFDRAFPKFFEFGSGMVRLPFAYALNRQFYLACFRYIGVLTQKSTFYTALTWCKLLLSLAPAEDPYGVRYFIDFYAIMSGEYRYLVRLCDSLLVTTYARWLTPGLAYSKVLALLYLEEPVQAAAALKQAYSRYPYTGFQLLETVGLAFHVPIDPKLLQVGPEVALATETYLVRAAAMWSEAKHRQFLHDTLLLLVGTKVESTKEAAVTELIPANLLRHAILSGESKLMAKIPAEVWEDNEIFDYDVLPPHADKSGQVERFTDYVDDNLVAEAIAARSQDDDMMEMIRQMSLRGQDQ
ncbi:hypothetical protein BABINDRAFT_174458 [Babjeviella inositovora NRRL Y-12698]|uniref:Uncharacterized protein n=1 Tax=Babjeviella inositovora NRRL Y-12698 TaxID=984486 RepID=A0A1E3QWB3_9ASCO|nr:uncharacterized protein BABINDRAFT_174458 [Babjeviella inositovora NRRL Y-12698]ODQ81854.1 hypothetical protein BABINDRAFT_174458 [Babjeviella inositovora NRRL Y-12698]